MFFILSWSVIISSFIYYGRFTINDFYIFFKFLLQSSYVLLLCSFKEQLQQHVRVHAMEAVMACWEIEQSLQSLTGTTILFLVIVTSQHQNKDWLHDKLE